MKIMTIRNISTKPTKPTEPTEPTELEQALEKERRRRGLSLNHTVLVPSRNALNVPSTVTRSNGIRHLAGRWSETEYESFEQAVAPFGEIDEVMWR